MKKSTWTKRRFPFCACLTCYACSYRDKDTTHLCLSRRTRTSLSSILIFHNSIFGRFPLTSVDTCLYDHGVSVNRVRKINITSHVTLHHTLSSAWTYSYVYDSTRQDSKRKQKNVIATAAITKRLWMDYKYWLLIANEL